MTIVSERDSKLIMQCVTAPLSASAGASFEYYFDITFDGVQSKRVEKPIPIAAVDQANERDSR